MLEIIAVLLFLPFILAFFIWKFILFDAPLYIIQYFYFNGEKFKEIKDKIQTHINECNELNNHIEELKNTYIDLEMGKIDYGYAEYHDSSLFSYKRPKWAKIKNEPNVYHCSRTIVNNAEQQPFKYVCKYFNINVNNDSIQKFESILNNFSAAENGKQLLAAEKETILKSIENDVPFVIRKFCSKQLSSKLGFEDVDLSDTYFPKFIFQYVSPGGNAEYSTNIVLNVDNLERFIHYLANQVAFRNTVQGQRQLMTRALRERIKQRDDYTCKKCGISTKDEPHLLLEIDHIKPLSKGGLTEEGNLQTLCWKCNRTKSNKYEDIQVNVIKKNNDKDETFEKHAVQTVTFSSLKPHTNLVITSPLALQDNELEIIEVNNKNNDVHISNENIAPLIENENDEIKNDTITEHFELEIENNLSYNSLNEPKNNANSQLLVQKENALNFEKDTNKNNNQIKLSKNKKDIINIKLKAKQLLKFLVKLIRYSIGVLFAFVGIVNIFIDNEYKLFSVVMALFGISIMPLIYKQIFNKFQMTNTNKALCQWLIPILCFILLVIIA